MLEKKHYDQGYRAVFGIDEAGRGPMAGPLVAGAVCLPLDHAEELPDLLKGVKDSKQMTERQREAAFETIQEVALAWGIGAVEAHEMPEIGNMTRVTLRAMQRALEDATRRSDIGADYLLIDYYNVPFFPRDAQDAIPKGDSRSLSIAAASVLAKVHRDRLMKTWATEFPQYGFERHKGYPTKQHRAALHEYGACPIHRQNYKLVKQAGFRLFDDPF